MNKNIMCVIPNSADATSFYRGVGPLSELRRRDLGYNFIFASRVSWDTISMVDAVFMQRPFNADHLTIIEMAKRMKRKVWIDYDDDLFTVPVSNPTFSMYSNDETRKTIAQIMAQADVITCSTYALEKSFKHFESAGVKVIRIPNGFNDHLLPEPHQEYNPRELALWRGSKTHEKDVYYHLGGIKGWVEENPKWTMAFTAQPNDLWKAAEVLPKKQTLFIQPMDLMEYHKFLLDVKPGVMMVPLAPDHFNQSKSNIAWLEAAYAGAAAVIPKWDEWEVPGFHYDVKGTPEEQGKITYRNFGEALVDATENRDRMIHVAKEAWSFVDGNLRVSKLNEERIKVLEYLLRK